MKSVLKKLFAPVALALALVGCAENPQDIAAKPAIIDAMVQNSLDICQTGPVNPDKAAYETRLRSILKDNRTTTLQEMQKHNVTVCLDQRLSHQKHGFWDEGITAVFYNNQNESGIVSLWDNGQPPENDSFWHYDARDRGYENIGRLAQRFRDPDIGVKASDTVLYAGVESCGKNCSSVHWHIPKNFDQATLRQNPELAKPPVPLPVVPPKPAS